MPARRPLLKPVTPVKKLDVYVLGKFLPLFFGSFFIVLFIFMMQFTWKYVDELIGKGLTLDVLSEFYGYMALSLVPQSLPLSVLLASLITFGNLGEKLELLAMKAAGVSLVRIMAPIAVLVVGLAGLSFRFQDKTSPDAQLKLRALLFSIKQTSPATEIPEGTFYNGIPGYNLFVEKKNAATGMLYGLMVYKTDQGFDRAQIVVADSGRMEMTTDKLHLLLDIWDGEQFENWESGNVPSMGKMQNPYDRETFRYKRFVIDFDSNFEKLDEDQLRGMASAKRMKQLVSDADSMEVQMDSVGRAYYAQARERFFRRPTLRKNEEAALAAMTAHKEAEGRKAKAAEAINDATTAEAQMIDFDQMMDSLPAGRRTTALQTAQAATQALQAELEWKSTVTADGDRFIRKHWIQWHQDITLSLACLFFFLIGAPLGAIIRKGGLGMPAVVSVALFIIYYIINTTGMKLSRDGTIPVVLGMWVSSAVLAPLGVFLTYKANNDSVVFNAESYMSALRRLLGLREHRHLSLKEVVIDVPDYTALLPRLKTLRDECRRYAEIKKLWRAPSYLRIFFRSRPDRRAAEIRQEMEAAVEELSNTRNAKIIHKLNELPLIYVRAHTTPFENRRLNRLCGVLFPVGLVLYFRIWRFRLMMHRDMRQAYRTLGALIPMVEEAAQRQTTTPPNQTSPS